MKNVDIKQLVQRSLLEAKKSHGLIREEEKEINPQSAEDKTKEMATSGMPKISLEARTWGSGETTTETEQLIEDYMSNLRGQKTNSIEEIRTFLARFNEALGMKVGSAGTPVYKEVEPSNATLPSIVSSLVLRQAVVSMVRHNKGGTAGELWEGFIARLLGKRLPDENLIEDIEGVDADGMLLSLKMLSKGEAVIKGSKINLAHGLSKPNVRGVRYFVGIKDDDDPFVVKFYSFDITKQNYFQFILEGNETPSQEEILKEIDIIKKKAGLLSPKMIGTPQRPIEINDEKYEVPVKLSALLKKGRDTLEADEELFKFIFQGIQDASLLQKIKELEIQINALSQEQKLSIIDKISTNKAIKAAPKNDKERNLVSTLLKEGNIEAILSGKSLGAFTGFFKSAMHTILYRILGTYDRGDDLDERKKLQGIINVLDDINVIFEEKKREIFQQLTKSSLAGFERHTNSMTNAIGDFWQSLSEVKDVKQDVAKIAGWDGQFKYRWGGVINFPFLHIDRNFQPIYIDKNQIFISTSKTVDLFREWAEPLYRNHAIMDTAIRKYFVKDDPSDMGKMESSVEETKVHLNKMKVGGEFQKATQLGKQPVAESKNCFTRNYIDDILDDL